MSEIFKARARGTTKDQIIVTIPRIQRELLDLKDKDIVEIEIRKI